MWHYSPIAALQFAHGSGWNYFTKRNDPQHCMHYYNVLFYLVIFNDVSVSYAGHPQIVQNSTNEQVLTRASMHSPHRMS